MSMILSYTAYSFGLMWLTWIFFSCIMRLQQVRDAGMLKGKVLCAFAYPTLIVGLLLDTLLNWTVMTLLFLELPKEFLTTARLCRWYEAAPNSWRGRMAAWFGATLLNPIDPSGKHVK